MPGAKTWAAGWGIVSGARARLHSAGCLQGALRALTLCARLWEPPKALHRSSHGWVPVWERTQRREAGREGEALGWLHDSPRGVQGSLFSRAIPPRAWRRRGPQGALWRWHDCPEWVQASHACSRVPPCSRALSERTTLSKPFEAGHRQQVPANTHRLLLSHLLRHRKRYW